jgi:hypothetical protein
MIRENRYLYQFAVIQEEEKVESLCFCLSKSFPSRRFCTFTVGRKEKSNPKIIGKPK